jgi:hypothetical protein
MTAEDIKLTGIPIDASDSVTMLMIESAVEYIAANTSLDPDVNDIETIKALPSCAKMFIVKYNEIMSMEGGVTSESLGGMSQSFATTDKDTLLTDLLNTLLGAYMNSQFKAVPAQRRWYHGC